MEYTEEQLSAIQKALESSISTDDIIYTSSNKIITKGAQRFVIQGSYAYEIPEIKDPESGIELVPVVLNGTAYLREDTEPDFGKTELLYLYRYPNKPWKTMHLNAGWLYTHELKLSNQEINDKIAEEIEQGHYMSGYRDGR
jgi:hypothetical protein